MTNLSNRCAQTLLVGHILAKLSQHLLYLSTYSCIVANVNQIRILPLNVLAYLFNVKLSQGCTIP